MIDPRLTAPVVQPELQGETNRDVWVLAVEQQQAIAECAERMQLIRELSR